MDGLLSLDVHLALSLWVHLWSACQSTTWGHAMAVTPSKWYPPARIKRIHSQFFMGFQTLNQCLVVVKTMVNIIMVDPSQSLSMVSHDEECLSPWWSMIYHHHEAWLTNGFNQPSIQVQDLQLLLSTASAGRQRPAGSPGAPVRWPGELWHYIVVIMVNTGYWWLIMGSKG